MRIRILIPLLLMFVTLHTRAQTAPATAPVIVGAMKKVMRGGELFPTISLDTLRDKRHLYGMGPLAYLKGETLILDGVGYTSRVINDSEMHVEQTMKFSAPFFGYAHISKWKQRPLPDSVRDLAKLERYLALSTRRELRPFFFTITCKASQAEVHLVNLPDRTKVSSPEEAHRGQRNYALNDEDVELLGFFSTEHQAIFTHHDTWLHIHLINKSLTVMGHLDQLTIAPGTARLYLPDNEAKPNNKR